MKKITESRKRFSVARLLAMILACMAVFLSSARAATIINVNMGNDGWNPLNGRGFMIGDFAQAPFKYPGTTWNDFSSPFPYGAAGLLDSQGNTTVVGFDTTSSTTIYGMEGPFTTADHVEVPVMRGFVRRVYNSGSGNTWHNRFTITNLTAGASYHLALIGVQGDQAAGAWQIGTATNHPDTAIKTIINSLPIHQNWVPSNNYAIFYNVTADANGRIYVWGKGQPTSGVTYPQGLTLNGFQLTTADVPSPEKQILSFSIGGVPMAIDEVSRTITLAVNGPLTSLTPTITTSAGATCSPASGVARNFSTPQTYTVTAADGTVDAYTVVLSSEKQLLSFKLYGQPMAIDQVNKTVTCNIYGPVTSLTPTITVSVGASCSPASGVARDFTTPQTYTVTALDGSVDSYTITAIQVAPPTITTRADGATLTTFTAPGVGPWTVPAGVSSVEVLTVGGGGGTGSQCSGAGAGGMYHTTGYSVTPGSSVIIAVGAGGVEGFNTGNYSGSSGGAGGISQFGQILAYGGQPGGGYRNGGDQGGYSMNGGTTVIPGVIAFHSSLAGGFYASGAGAGDPGTSYQSDGVPGGNGTNCTITGSEVWYAGGGGSPNNPGTGGRGGGGHGAGSAITEDLMCGTDGLGGGAGGGWGAGTWTGGGRGGSGVVIVAYFVGVTTYEVTFDSKGGSDVPKQTVAAGGTATLPPPPIKAGYTFVQWCSDTGLTTAFDFATPIYANKTLYAKWSINTYTLTYLAGAYGSLIGTTTQTVQYAASGTAVTAVPMTGGTFVKWSDNVTANPRTDSNVSSNITVTAIFNPPFPGIATRSDGATVARFYQGTGTWTVPAGVTSVEVLVVGGGGGACPQSSGAGGGGMYYTTSYSVTPGSTVNIAVGAGGGAGSPPMGSGIPGTNGGISQFGQLLAYGGQGMSGYGPTDDPSGNHGGNQGGYSSDGGAITNAGNLGGICAHGNYASGAGAGAPGV